MPAGQLRVGDIFSRAVPVWQRLIGPFAVIYVLELIPTVLQSFSAQHQRAHGVGQFGLSLGIAVLLGSLIGLIAHAASVDATMRVLGGGAPRLMEAIDIGMRRFVPLLIAWFVGAIVIGFGLILLVVPGVIASLMFFVVTPVCVVERRGPIDSLERSGALTKGSRWALLGIFLVLVVMSGGAALAAFVAKSVAGPVAGAVVQALVSAAIGLLSSIITTITYTELVAAKEGYGGSRIASVFD